MLSFQLTEPSIKAESQFGIYKHSLHLHIDKVSLISCSCGGGKQQKIPLRDVFRHMVRPCRSLGVINKCSRVIAESHPPGCGKPKINKKNISKEKEDLRLCLSVVDIYFKDISSAVF